MGSTVFRDLKRGGQVWAFVLSGTPHKEWTRPPFGPWAWTRWARQALSPIFILFSVHYMYGMSGFAEKLNLQNCENSTENCVHHMYGMSGLANKLTI